MNATTNELSPTVARVAPDQRNAFGGIWRLTVWQFLSRNHLLTVAGLTGLLAVIATTAAPKDGSGYTDWLINFYLSVLAPTLAFLSGAAAMQDAAKPGSADYIFTRPVRRWAYVGFRYVAHTACTLAMWLPAFAVVVVSGSVRQLPAMGTTFSLVLLAQGLTLAAFVALGFLCAVLTRRYLIVGLVYAAIIEVGVGNIPAPLSRLSITRQVRELLEPQIAGGLGDVSWSGLLAATGGTALFVAAFVGVAAALFSRQELSGARSQE